MIRGESKKISVTVTNKTTGAVVDCSAATGILIALYHPGGKILAKWSKNAKDGFGDIDTTDANVGVLVVYTTPAQTADGINERELNMEVKIAFDNPDYPDGKQISIDTNIKLESIEKSIFEGVDPI